MLTGPKSEYFRYFGCLAPEFVITSPVFVYFFSKA